AEVRRHGYEPSDTHGYQSGLDLGVIIGALPNTADAPPEQAFFFRRGQYLGTDASDPSVGIRLAWQNGDTVALEYTLYHLSDPRCCPTAGSATVRFQRDGSRLLPLDPIPASGTGADPTRY